MEVLVFLEEWNYKFDPNALIVYIEYTIIPLYVFLIQWEVEDDWN